MPRPGQFILVSCVPELATPGRAGQGDSERHYDEILFGIPPDRTLLMRPMSIFDYSGTPASGASITLLFKVIGRGTFLLSRAEVGQRLRVLGPLGNGFSSGGWRKVLLVAGGIGISGLFFLAKALVARSIPTLVVLGVNSKRNSPLPLAQTEVVPAHHWAMPETIEPLNLVVSRLFDIFVPSVVASLYPGDDGAFCGSAVELVEQLFRANPTYARQTTLVACGPVAMLASLADVARHWRVMEYLVLMEERMACGVGSCLGCAVPVREPAGEAKSALVGYRLVCKQGPVMDGHSIVWKQAQ